MPRIEVKNQQERWAEEIIRHQKSQAWFQKVANQDKLCPFAWSHFTTALENYQLGRWEGAISFSGLALEEELASLYATDVPKKRQPLKKNSKDVDLNEISSEGLITWAEGGKLISDKVAVRAHQVRKARNFFSHAYAIMRQKIIKAIAQGTVSDLIPEEIGVPDYLAELITKNGSGAVPPGVLNSQGAAEKVIEATVEVLIALTQ